MLESCVTGCTQRLICPVAARDRIGRATTRQIVSGTPADVSGVGHPRDASATVVWTVWTIKHTLLQKDWLAKWMLYQ